MNLDAWTSDEEWEQRYRIALDEVCDADGNTVVVSTVRLAVHLGEPFETMVFDRYETGSEWHNHCERYTSEEAAREGHAAVLRAAGSAAGAEADPKHAARRGRR